jgi:Tfp pilus assembly protein PilW
MTTSTPRTSGRARAFTLVEVMVSAGLSTLLMSGVLSSFLLMGKNSYNAANYSVMEAQSRRALMTFTTEARMADNIVWNSAASVTLSVVDSAGSYLVTYAYDSATVGNTAQTFYRQLGSGPPLILVRNVSDFAFRRYKVVNGEDFTATNDLETKQVQITLRTVRSGVTTVDATNAVISARVVLRNKRVTT